jgi:predicted nucleotidyltransferase component of viral defense system
LLPEGYITHWKSGCPWSSDEYVEQDLILSRLLIELFSDEVISHSLVFRGGTALHKLYLPRACRYSEDLDFVQLKPGKIGDTLSSMRRIIGRIVGGRPDFNASKKASNLIYKYHAENPPNPLMKIKLEINTRDHYSYDVLKKRSFEINSPWFTGKSEIVIYSIEGLLATKLRALYQRRKGRDLFDFWISKELKPDAAKTVSIFHKYMGSENKRVSKADFIKNIDDKIKQPVFRNDLNPLIPAELKYDIDLAHKYFMNTYISCY